MAFLEDLRALSEAARRRIANIKGEEATKQALVLPFFQALGYDVYDPTEVQPEFVSDFAKKKNSGGFEKVDYAIRLNDAPVMLVECKSVGTAPEDHDGQLARYFNATTSVKVGIITNGTNYRFFTDLQATNVMDTAPFLEFNVLEFNERESENLRAFTKLGFNAAAVQSYAEEIIYTQRITGVLARVLRDPSENFVRFLLAEIDLVQGRLTAKVVERFQPIVRRALQSTIVEMMTRGIQQEIAYPQEPAHLPIAAAPSATDSAPIEGSKTITTPEEMDLFELVKSITLESPLKRPVSFKDTSSYFGINIGGKVSRWFVRAHFNGSSKYLAFRVGIEPARALAAGLSCEPVNDATARSRVFVTSGKDAEKLRALLLLAYEDEARRLDGDAEG